MEETGEARGAFGGFIGPRTLLAQVWNTAPWLLRDVAPDGRGRALFERAHHPLGWRAILAHAHQLQASESPDAEQWLEYFALCLAAHFGTCGTYVPTDVDTKIRGHLWFRLRDDDCLEAAIALARTLGAWDITSVQARTLTYPAHGTISGHDGERLSVLAAGVLRCLVRGHADGARVLTDLVDDELAREVRIFEWLCGQPGREIEIACVAANLTHNAGDLDQGLACEEGRRVGADVRPRWARLAHERFERFGGAFRRAAAVNRAVMAPEAHRHYPLRRIALLREDPRWLRPAGPFLDAWGASLARNEAWSIEQQGEILEGLLLADKRVDGQRGYVRALVGYGGAWPGGLDLARWKAHLGTAARRHLKSAGLRQRLGVSRASFEGSMAKAVRVALGR